MRRRFIDLTPAVALIDAGALEGDAMLPLSMPIARVAALGSLSVLALTACSSPGSATTPTQASNQAPFTCCSSDDASPVRHPGDTVELHWFATSSDPSAAGAVITVRLDAGLSGPFESVADLKAADAPAAISAPTVVATAASDDAPVSVIQIPEDAQAGFYDLSTTLSHDGSRHSSKRVIRVESN